MSVGGSPVQVTFSLSHGVSWEEPLLLFSEESSLPGENRSTNLSSREAAWFGEEKFWIQGTSLLLNACVIVGKLPFP